LPGGEFNKDRFMQQIAVGGGAGLRLDISFIVVRLDVAFPWRVPSLEGNNWILDGVKLGSKAWRKDNLVYNLAIGYPF
jgi:outer membrane protein insertion porin family